MIPFCFKQLPKITLRLNSSYKQAIKFVKIPR